MTSRRLLSDVMISDKVTVSDDVMQRVSDVTVVDDVTETESWVRRSINVPLQLIEYRRKPSATDVSVLELVLAISYC